MLLRCEKGSRKIALKFGRGYKITGMKIVLRDWDLRDVGSVCVFGDDYEIRRIPRLMSRGVPVSLGSF